MGEFIEIFRQNFYELEAFLHVDSSHILLSLLGALISGLIIFLVYKFFFKGVVYNENFNILLVLITIISAFVVMVFARNVIVALGMVGAMGMIRIVRFRTTIKDPLDVGFILWALCAGIVSGIGFSRISILVTIGIGILYILMTKFIRLKTVYLLVISYEKDEDDIIKALGKMRYRIKTKTEGKKGKELIIQFATKKPHINLVSDIKKVAGVSNVSLVEYDGDFLQ